jgi:hypothetical protein
MDSQQGGNEAQQASDSLFSENTNLGSAGNNTVYPQASKGFMANTDNFATAPAERSQTNTSSFEARPSGDPIPVVKVLSIRGIEYVMMSLALWFGAGGLIWILLALIYGSNGFSALAFPVSLLVVCVPVFSVFFIRLRKQELANPDLRYEASKRRLSQITQILAFIVCLFNLVGFVYLMMAKAGGESKASVSQSVLGLLAILAVAGGILVYYWFDEHRNIGK